MEYDFVFVVLVYRNTQDLKDFFESFTVPQAKIIVVNSYFDEITEKKFMDIASLNNADYLSVANMGYGVGNNQGCKYALANYTFKYLVISNSDILIQKIDVNILKKYPHGIYAPSIRTLKNKQQNPHMPYYCKTIDNLKYLFFLKNNWNAILFFCAINKILRILFLTFNKLGARKIYSAHGAFVIIPVDIVKALFPFYDENVFLFTEEENLAQCARMKGVSTYFTPEIRVKHKEDGSTSTIFDKQREITRNSYISFWNKWHKN